MLELRTIDYSKEKKKRKRWRARLVTNTRIKADDSSIIVNDVNIGHLTGEEEKENPKKPLKNTSAKMAATIDFTFRPKSRYSMRPTKIASARLNNGAPITPRISLVHYTKSNLPILK